MKKILAMVLAVAMLLALCMVPSFAEDDNLLEDPCADLDEIIAVWPNGWAAGIAQEWSDQSHTADGSGSIKLQNDVGGNQHCTQPIFLEGGKTYKLAGWIKVDEDYNCKCAGACGAYFAINEPNGGIPSGTYSSSAGWKDTNEVLSGWNYFESEYTPAEDIDTFFSLCLWGTGGTAYFDDLYVGEAGSPYAPVDPIYLSDLECKSWITYHASSEMEVPDYEPWFNRQEGLNANGNENILIGGKEYEKGIQLHASDLPDHLVDDEPAGEVVYDISAYTDKYNAFKCVFGGLTQTNDTVVSAGHTNCTEIWVDGECIYASDYIDNTSPIEIAVAIPSGAKEIRLLSKAGKEFNSEWFAWADARLDKDDSLKPAEPEATPEPTAEPEATPEPTAEATPEPSSDATAEPTSAPEATPEASAEPAKKGCKGVVISGAAVMALALAGAVVVLNKKH